MFFVYVLKSELSGKHYYGHTQNIEVRLKQHNAGRVRSTKAYGPWQIIHKESFELKSEAFKRELFFKSIDGYHFLKSQGII